MLENVKNCKKFLQNFHEKSQKIFGKFRGKAFLYLQVEC